MATATFIRWILEAFRPAAKTRNEAGGPAYVVRPSQALAQLAATGCLNATFYADAERQTADVLGLARRVSPEFVAKTAVFCRERGHMKDMPALLLTELSRRDPVLMDRVFDRVVDTPRMLRTFVRIVRSGATGRKSLGTAPKRCVRRWLNQRTDAALFAASVGDAPSLADVIKMVHPKPNTTARDALYGYLTGRQAMTAPVPPIVRQFEAFKAGNRRDVPDVPFQMLTALDLTRREWSEIARRGSWQMLRMNLNTFARHGVFDEPGMAEHIATRLRDRAEVARARVLPYQLLAAHRAIDPAVPGIVRAAIEAALELAIATTPSVDGKIYVCPDVSGSMRSPITGRRKGATTKVRCVDAAALMTAALVRRNPDAEVLPFDDAVVSLDLSWRDSVLTNAERLASVGGGGTSVSAPLARLNARRARGELVVIVSDNQSWVDASAARDTATIREWNRFRSRNPRARLVLIDLQPYTTTQAAERTDVLNVGGFSDQVFEIVSEFATGRLQSDHWVGAIEAIAL